MITIFCNLPHYFFPMWFGGGCAAGGGGAAGTGYTPSGSSNSGPTPPVPRVPLPPGDCPRENGGSTTGNPDEDDYDNWRSMLNDFIHNDAYKGDRSTWAGDETVINNIKKILKDHPGKHQHADDVSQTVTYWPH